MDVFSSYNHYVNYIQAKFFRTGVCTHLHIATPPLETADGVSVTWKFSFQDLGSSHIISSHASVVILEPSGKICVNGVVCPTLDAMEAAIFGGHYESYVLDLYEFEGILS